jgi:hypothetical protein
MDLTIGGTSYRLFAVEGDGQWIARAFRGDTGERFGVDAAAETEDAAIALLRSWLEWNHDHGAALDALQHAERAYHRIVTGAAFAEPESAVASDQGKASLDTVDSARAALDAVRARRPSV